MPIEVTMPRLSDTMQEGKILRWLKHEGDAVAPGDVIAEVETDKADMELEAFDEGILEEIRVAEGESAPVGAVIAILRAPGEEAGAGRAASAPPAPMDCDPQALAPPARAAAQRARPGVLWSAAPTPVAERVRASPLARRLAAEMGVDLRAVKGSGPGGRILREDVEGVAGCAAPPPERPALQSVRSAPQPLTGEQVGLSRMRQTIARRMSESKRDIPHFYVTAEIDMTNAVRMKKSIEEAALLEVEITYTDLVVKAVAMALRRHAEVNASYADGAVELKSEVNVGMAVAVEDGLVVPVIRRCDTLGLDELARRARELTEHARTGRFGPSDLSGGTFTVSNLGMFPVDSFAAVINPPQAAILAVGAIGERAVARGGRLAVAHTMKVTLSCDHRVIDGVIAARFLAEVARLLEHPESLLLAGGER